MDRKRILQLMLCFCLENVLATAEVSSAEQKCLDSQGRMVESGDRFIPSRSRPCVECLCIHGNSVLCGMALCVGKVNCTLPRWNVSICCKPECIKQKLLFTGVSGSPPKDLYHLPYPGTYFDPDTGSVFGMDDAYLSPASLDISNPPPDSSLGNETSTVAKTQTLPSPYYPILIGLISCAPVALCIICINALRKYFAMRNHLPNGAFFPRRRGFLTRGPLRAAVHGTNQIATHPSVYVDPPPAYNDLTSTKLKMSEELPKYEDVLKYDQESNTNKQKIFATTSSVQFHAPETVILTNLCTGVSTSISPVNSETREPQEVIITESVTRRELEGGIDNPAREP